MNKFDQHLEQHRIHLKRSKPTILQLNIGKLCNLTCQHCHVNAGPWRKEIMSRETIDKTLTWLESTDIPTIDLTGGAPEMIPDFRYLVESIKKSSKPRHIIDRCNLTILLEPNFEDMADFLAKHKVEIIASMPCYSPENVNEQRGNGVFDGSIKALQLLNKIGYGIDEKLPLHLVYNPIGASLPPEQTELEADYKHELKKHFDIVFNRLYTITNMPIARFESYLKQNKTLSTYYDLLIENFNPHAVENLMCRDTINVSYTGKVYDCDFNQMLAMPMKDQNKQYLWDLDYASLERQSIHTAPHCFGCTAGTGSSCQGALME